MDEKIQAQLQNIEYQVNTIREQMTREQEHVASVVNTINTLEQYEKLDEDKNSLTPLGERVLAKSLLKKSSKVFIDVGGVLFEKTIPETIEMLKKESNAHASNINEMSKAVAEMQKRYTMILKESQASAKPNV